VLKLERETMRVRLSAEERIPPEGVCREGEAARLLSVGAVRPKGRVLMIEPTSVCIYRRLTRHGN